MTTKVRHLPVEKEAYFPNLTRDDYQVTSPETVTYNCIAHAAGADDRWWWPEDASGVHWPHGIAKAETLECFISAYGTVGYTVCDPQSREAEPGIEKIAIYVDPDGAPTHAARQLADGSWTSKLGEWEDIQHRTLEAVEDKDGLGLGYGRVALIMKRPAVQDQQR